MRYTSLPWILKEAKTVEESLPIFRSVIPYIELGAVRHTFGRCSSDVYVPTAIEGVVNATNSLAITVR